MNNSEPTTDVTERENLTWLSPLPLAGATTEERVAPSSPADAPGALPLELGWTRMGRKRPRLLEENELEISVDEGYDCEIGCLDPSCRRKTSFLPETATANSDNYHRCKGRAVWLLHDLESEWFQGYFYAIGQARPWGLLALIQELDECLQCSEGGYRQIRLQVLLPSSSNASGNIKKDLGIVEWTGGDMMRLESAVVKMEPDSVVTGNKAASITTDLFKGVWKQLRSMYNEQVEGGIEMEQVGLLELLPDVAVVRGSMEFDLPCDA